MFSGGRLISFDDGSCAFITSNTLSFSQAMATVKLLPDSIAGAWRLASIQDIQRHRLQLKTAMREALTTKAWVSNVIELETESIDKPRFYNCDMKLSTPANGSMAMRTDNCLGLFFFEAAEVLLEVGT